MIDFTNAKEEFNIYKGSEKKKTLIIDNKRYLVKFPDPIRKVEKNISYINNTFSEYIGCNIFKICGFDVQNTVLGKYESMGKTKIICACEDFTDEDNILYEFENLALSINTDKKIGTELSDIMEVIDNANMIDIKETKEKFWELFIIDGLIGNTDRHNGNWGFIKNKKENKIKFAKIYDCGSCLNPLLEDSEISKLTSSDIKNLAINSFSCLKEDGKRINYFSYLKKMTNEECTEALKRIFNKINLLSINEFINSVEPISNTRKKFYKSLIQYRYNLLKEIYNKITTD